MLRDDLPVRYDAGEVGPRRTDYPVWRRSTNEGSVAAPAAEPKFEAGPPSLPPTNPAPAQRRFNFLIVGLTVLLATGLVAGLVVYDHNRAKRSSASSESDEVRQAYLEFTLASAEAYKQLDVAPVEGLVTGAGLKQQRDLIASVAQTGHRYQIRTEHDMQIVVFMGDVLASVDDNILRHTTLLDVSTLTPTGAETSDVIHESFVLKKQNGRWLVDSVLAFGTGTPESGLTVSYAAASRDQPVPASLKAQISASYEAYWAVHKSAFAGLDSNALPTVEIEPQLDRDRSLIDQWRQKSQGYAIQVEHNYRVARQDDATIWVYDSYADSSYPFELSSKKPVEQLPMEVVRKSFQFKRVGDTWKVAFGTVYQ
jgi:hypothetical protein